MESNRFTRRGFSVQLAAFLSGLGVAGTAFGARFKSGGSPQSSASAGNGDISHACESIHQEVVFKATRKRVYDALTDAKQFNKVVQLSDAMRSGAIGTAPAEISREAGGAFSLFGGYISGRNIELVPVAQIVQAWRVGSWKPGVYSIVKFELAEQGAGTGLVLDHRGFPDGMGQHLAEGWYANYWQPLAKYLA